MLKEILHIVEQGFTGKKVVVIGDLMLDRYLLGDVSRVSPEAPVPVLKAKDEKHTLGGAGNVALNLKGLEISTFLISMIGTDQEGGDVKDILASKGISSEYIISSDTKPTITKTRIVGENQQITRIDRENTEIITEDLQSRIIENIKGVIQKNAVDAVIISDYAKGLMTDEICETAIREAKNSEIPVIIDPKGKTYRKYKDATILMPNEEELALACNGLFKTDEALKSAARGMLKKFNIRYLAVTRGAKGISLITKNFMHDIPARAREVYDVSGAGDTVIALATAGLIMDLSIERSLELANLAASYVVRKFGTHPITYSELNDVIHRYLSNDQKLFGYENFKDRLKYLRNNNKRIVFTNGCFDILHAGHIHLLKNAKQEGDHLIVALNTDESIRRLKGSERPINSLEDRISVLEAISYVDAIIPFSEATPLNLIEKIKPDVLVKGADYEEDEIAGAPDVKVNGGRVVRVPLLNGKSTSRLINQGVSTDG